MPDQRICLITGKSHERYSTSNHQQLGDSLFRLTAAKIPKHHITGRLWGQPTGEKECPCHHVPWYFIAIWNFNIQYRGFEAWRDVLTSLFLLNTGHDDVIKWKHFPRYWPFVRGIHRSPVNSPHKGQWRGVLMFFFICVWINGWVNNGEAGDLRRYRAHYDVTVMQDNTFRPDDKHTRHCTGSSLV